LEDDRRKIAAISATTGGRIKFVGTHWKVT
jgi:hypothetical protein